LFNTILPKKTRGVFEIMKTIAVLLEFGFEEIEMIVPVDILRRLGFNVIIAGAKDLVEGSHGLKLKPDLTIKEIDHNKLDCVILPGGMPGSVNLLKNNDVLELLKRISQKNALIAAICAAPIVLAEAGLTAGLKITAHPSVKDQLKGAIYTGNLTEKDRNIITGKGPGASFEFADRIASALGKASEAKQLLKDMFIF